MTTELLKRAVIPYLTELNYPFSAEDRTVRFYLSIEEVPMYVGVWDLKSKSSTLCVQVPCIVKFPPEQDVVGLRLTNRLNRFSFGKFILFKDRSLFYRHYTYVDDAGGVEAFKSALRNTAYEVNKAYPAIMRVRWANLSIDDALQPPESTVGGDRPCIQGHSGHSQPAPQGRRSRMTRLRIGPPAVPTRGLLECVRDSEYRLLFKRPCQYLKANRQPVLRQASRNRHPRQTRDVGGQGEHVGEVHLDRVGRLLTKPERHRRRRCRHDGVELLERPLELAADDRPHLLRLQVVGIVVA